MDKTKCFECDHMLTGPFCPKCNRVFTAGEIRLAAALGFAFGIFIAGLFVRLLS